MSDTVQVLADDNPLAVDASRYHLIDDKTRALTQPEDENEKILGVETDKDAVRRYFKCPKIVGDNIDLTQCQLYVGYIGAKDEKGKLFFDEEPGRYHCDDVSEDGDYLLFSWKLSGNVFLRDGYVAYNIYAVSNNGDEAEMVWNTTPAIGEVLRTVPKGTDIVERFPDVINQLFERLLALEAKIGNGGGTSFSGSAADVTYNNEKSKLDAENVQDALDKLQEEIDDLVKSKRIFYATESTGTGKYYELAFGLEKITPTNVTPKIGDLLICNSNLYEIEYVYDDRNQVEGTTLFSMRGDTPIKGTDYFTNADKQEIVTDVLNALPTWTGGSY